MTSELPRRRPNRMCDECTRWLPRTKTSLWLEFVTMLLWLILLMHVMRLLYPVNWVSRDAACRVLQGLLVPDYGLVLLGSTAMRGAEVRLDTLIGVAYEEDVCGMAGRVFIWT